MDDEKEKKVNRYQEIFDVSEEDAKKRAISNVGNIFGDSNIYVTVVNVAGRPRVKKDKKGRRDEDSADYYDRKYNNEN